MRILRNCCLAYLPPERNANGHDPREKLVDFEDVEYEEGSIGPVISEIRCGYE
jgi:hypothetical protein